jgi:hypothetical protein
VAISPLGIVRLNPVGEAKCDLGPQGNRACNPVLPHAVIFL